MLQLFTSLGPITVASPILIVSPLLKYDVNVVPSPVKVVPSAAYETVPFPAMLPIIVPSPVKVRSPVWSTVTSVGESVRAVPANASA